MYKQLKCKEYVRIFVEKAEKEVGGWHMKHYITVIRQRELAKLRSVK